MTGADAFGLRWLRTYSDQPSLMAFYYAGESEEQMGNREQDLHEHRCAGCGLYWTCRKTDCQTDDLCESCEEQRVDEWLTRGGYDTPQADLLTAVAEEENLR